MPRFLTGDELGNIKALRYSPDTSKTEIKTIRAGYGNGISGSVQALAVGSNSGNTTLISAAFSDGHTSVYSLGSDDIVDELHQWKETRLKPDQRYVGLAMSKKGIFSCTSNGALRLTPLKISEEETKATMSSLPTRLRDWRLSQDEETFAYGGDEVDLSVWNAELALSPRSLDSTAPSKKRKRNEDLYPGEVWRAKNIPNDMLGLRQPIRIASLTYLSPTSGSHHLLTGTQLGDVRRYDTRAARRPVSNWMGIGKAGGVNVLEKGICEHEVFIGDNGNNLFSLDLRNGRVTYGYKGMSGAMTGVAPSPGLLASTALDRFARLHSVFPPSQPGQQQEQKGKILEKVFTTSIPTTVVWDLDTSPQTKVADFDEDDVWDHMENIEGDNA